jgi:hypothetical protein
LVPGGIAAPQTSKTPGDATMDDDKDLAKLNDDEFLSVCRTVHRVAERTPEDELSAEARERLDQVNDEFLRRAQISWQRVS